MSHSTLADFNIIKQIGKGSFGVVYMCRRKVDDQIYVLKEIKLAGASKKEIEAAVNECHVLAKIDSQYVVRYYDSFVDTQTETLWLVMEYASHGTLRDLIMSYTTHMPEEEVWFYACQILLGISSVHVQRIIHRDIKSLNVFVCEKSDTKTFLKYSLKVGDMGVAKEMMETNYMAQTLVGSPYYLSPEICKSEKYNSKSDIWAIGITLYEMMNMGKHPFLAKNQASLIVKILKGKYEPLNDKIYSQALRDLVYWCLRMNPASRPDVFTLLAIPAVRGKVKQFGLVMPPDVDASVRKAEANFSKALSNRRTSNTTPTKASRDASGTPVSDGKAGSHAAARGRTADGRTSGAGAGANANATIVGVDTDIVQCELTDEDKRGAQRGGQQSAPTSRSVCGSFAKDRLVDSVAHQPASAMAPSRSLASLNDVSGTPGSEYIEDFDNVDEPEAARQTTVRHEKARPETAARQKQLERLLARDAELSTTQIELFSKINAFGVAHSVRDELIKFFLTEDDGSEERLVRFVFGRIGYEKIDMIDVLRSYTKVQQERQAINKEISVLLSQISAAV